MGNYPRRRMNNKLTNSMKMWKENGNTTTLLLSLKRLEIVHQERKQVKTIVTEHFNGILFHKSGSSNKQHTNQTYIFGNYLRIMMNTGEYHEVIYKFRAVTFYQLDFPQLTRWCNDSAMQYTYSQANFTSSSQSL